MCSLFVTVSTCHNTEHLLSSFIYHVEQHGCTGFYIFQLFAASHYINLKMLITAILILRTSTGHLYYINFCLYIYELQTCVWLNAAHCICTASKWMASDNRAYVIQIVAMFHMHVHNLHFGRCIPLRCKIMHREQLP